MIEALIESLKPIFNTLNWVENYGGLVETWPMEVAVNEDGTQTKTEFFPVSRGTKPDSCSLDECRARLSPDERYRSVVFWALQGEVKVEPPKRNISRANGMMQYSQEVRLIVWLNFTGCDNCDATSWAAYAQNLVTYLNRARVQSADPVGAAGRLKITSEAIRDAKDIFSPWTFNEEARYFASPFDFFALDFTFEWFQNAKCQIQPVC